LAVIVYLIGGGPSAGGLDTERLRGGLRIGVNDAAFHKPCDMFFTNDHGYALGIREKIEAFPGERHLCTWWKFHGRFEGWPVRRWHRRDCTWPSRFRDELSSGPPGTPGCSGYVAMNLAVQLGAKTIVLLGYDFHDDYRYFFSPVVYPRVKIAGVLQSFRQVAPWYREQGIEVLNANPDSAIHAFRKIAHREALAIA
jgi:hypothetical protein